MFSDSPITEMHVEETEQATVDLQEIMERDELVDDQPRTDYGMISYEL